LPSSEKTADESNRDKSAGTPNPLAALGDADTRASRATDPRIATESLTSLVRVVWKSFDMTMFLSIDACAHHKPNPGILVIRSPRIVQQRPLAAGSTTRETGASLLGDK
jgi:hypothetical protein